jgi:hypothetical protein
MGFFSWITQDTKRSISNQYSTIAPFKVIMADNKGNQWVEEDYEGYGVFGGKDYYELLAEMNGEKPDRNVGIDLFFGGGYFIAPSLSECGKYYDGKPPKDCPAQGYFYGDNDIAKEGYDVVGWD